ncbi:methyltransferase domain-containing protein (plasmid) [Peteryoungia desertarenae]|uniref:Methyltransferase domain-containing protein n=1 Tax=Peteryoungia desertarenae TaxID=1813451 RepID=A0ABX6QU97_9HYPH|nr:class I SAM-dependent methyltransferase [Peteryoungia desertarenae]QLF71760.1 methyltransferase domain-containing protein [Peteryoungia desertarenae]
MNNQHCRFCNSPLTHVFADLGVTPLANSYVRPDQAGRADRLYPLRTLVCTECWLVQAEAFASPEEIFSDYAYFSSYSDSWVAHARRFTEDMTARFGLGAGSQVIEVASNDGYLLQHFVERGIPALGIEPAANVAEVARGRGVPTECCFFGRDTAGRLAERGLSADLLVGNNVLAHVPDINDFAAGLAIALKPHGIVSLEFPHLLQLMRNTQFDTIYHEHFYYLSLLAVERIFAAHGLMVFDVQELPTHGGSLRVLAQHASSSHHAEQPGIAKVRQDEAEAGFAGLDAYLAFQTQIDPLREGLLRFLSTAKAEGKTVVAYGAAAKGNTFLNFCGITTDLIAYVVDRNPHKQGHLLPGSRLPIHAPDRLAETRPDYVLILPWNLSAEITASMDLGAWGGRFLVAVPQIQILP